MKFNLHLNRFALNAIISVSFPVHNADALILQKAIDFSPVLYHNVDEICEGGQYTMLLKALYDNICNKVCKNISRITNRVVSSQINIFNNKCVFVFVCGNNKTLVKKVISMILKSITPFKVFPLYKINCDLIGCKVNREEYIYLTHELISSLDNMDICVSAKLKYESESEFQKIFKEIGNNKLNIEKISEKGNKPNVLKPVINVPEFNYVVSSPFLPQIYDLISLKVNVKKVGDMLIFNKSIDMSKLLDSNTIENYIKKYMKLKAVFNEVITHDMLLNGVPHSAINNISIDAFKKSFGQIFK